MVDARKGHVTLIAAADDAGGTATAEFWAGIFRLTQSKGNAPTTILTLVEKLRCPRAGNTIASATKKKRRLWGDGSGKFRTKGKHSAATVVGTTWLVEDRCASTLTRVKRGRRLGPRLRQEEDGGRPRREEVHGPRQAVSDLAKLAKAWYSAPMAQVGMHEAKTKLSQLVERAEAGEEIVIARNGKPVARLVPVAAQGSFARLRGALRGQIHMADDFDELPDDIAEAFGAR